MCICVNVQEAVFVGKFMASIAKSFQMTNVVWFGVRYSLL